MNAEALGRAGILAGSEFALDLAVLLLVYLNPRSPPGEITPAVRRPGPLRPVGAIAASHAVQWAGICAIAAAGIEPRSVASFVAFGSAWVGGLAAGAWLLRRLLVTRCDIDAASARELVVAKLVVHGVVWLFACVYARVML